MNWNTTGIPPVNLLKSDGQGRKLHPQLTYSFLLWPVDEQVAYLSSKRQSLDLKMQINLYSIGAFVKSIWLAH